MSGAARRIGIVTLVASGAVWVAWLGFGVQAGGDYPGTFAPGMNALLAGRLGAFFHLLPADGAGGSLLLRAPGALAGKLLVGTPVARFRFGALECTLAAGLLGLWLAHRMRPPRLAPAARIAVVALCLFAPALLDTILVGHPEEVLGAVLCVAAVLLATDDRPGLAGLALGLAIVGKPWALLAIAPVLLAAPEGRMRLAAVAAGACAAWYGTAFLVASGHFEHSLAQLSTVAHPQELWWPFAMLERAPGAPAAYFLPALITDHARELAVLLMVPLSLPLIRRRERTVQDCLALLALLFLLRCMLDPSNHDYYQVPFVLAFTAWEALGAGLPVLALLATGGLWLAFGPIAGGAGLGLQFLAYMAVTIPYVIVLARAVLGPRADATAEPRWPVSIVQPR